MSRCDCAHVHWMPPRSFALFHLQKSWSTRIRSIHISGFLGPVSNTMDKCGLRYRIFLMFIANDISSESIFILENQWTNEEARFHLWASLCVCGGSDSMQYLPPRWDFGTLIYLALTSRTPIPCAPQFEYKAISNESYAYTYAQPINVNYNSY